MSRSLSARRRALRSAPDGRRMIQEQMENESTVTTCRAFGALIAKYCEYDQGRINEYIDDFCYANGIVGLNHDAPAHVGTITMGAKEEMEKHTSAHSEHEDEVNTWRNRYLRECASHAWNYLNDEPRTVSQWREVLRDFSADAEFEPNAEHIDYMLAHIRDCVEDKERAKRIID